jgi:hypothetical protein
MVFFGSMMKTERMVNACVGRISMSNLTGMGETYDSLGVDIGGILVIDPVRHN